MSCRKEESKPWHLSHAFFFKKKKSFYLSSSICPFTAFTPRPYISEGYSTYNYVYCYIKPSIDYNKGLIGR